MFQVRLKIELSSDWALHTINIFNCELNSLYCANIDENNVLDIIVFSNITKQDELLEFLQKENTIAEFEVLDKQDKYLICKIITQYETIIYPVLKHKCFMLGNIKVKNNSEYWTVGSNDKNNIKELIKTLNKTRKTKLLEIKEYKFERKELTDKQYQIIKYAHKRGYFEIPKKTDLGELANELSISKSTLAVHLQKAEKKILENFITNSNEYVRQ